MPVAQGPDPALLARWQGAEGRFNAFLNSVGANDDVLTTATMLEVIPIDEADFDEYATWLFQQPPGHEAWRILTVDVEPTDGKKHVFALPVRTHDKESWWCFPFVDPHSHMVAWWLLTAWRARQLARATAEHADSHQLVAAAACGRSVVETAAAFWADARLIADEWNEAKRGGGPGPDNEPIEHWRQLSNTMATILYGAKFNSRVPDLNDSFRDLDRTNVLTQIDKLAKAIGSEELHKSYQWLCNTVHPSAGGTFAFSGPNVTHNTRTYKLVRFSAVPREWRTPPAHLVVQEATATAMSIALDVLVQTLDAALRVVDDFGMTTGAGRMCLHEYWRSRLQSPRNGACPCRSGRKAKRCSHEWGEPGPTIPAELEA